jgi:hypothetical protein
MRREAYEQLKQQSVEFLVRDIYLPLPAAILAELHENQKLTGVVADLSDDARDERAAFVVVEVAGLRVPCIVPAERVRVISPAAGTTP